MPARRQKPAAPAIPLETWRTLYTAAEEFGRLALWKTMGDAELLGAHDPRDGQPVLAAVMGGRGEVFGLAIHYGPTGLRWVLELSEPGRDEPQMDDFLGVHVIKLEFVKKGELPDEDKRRFQELGFAPTGGRGARWPTFASQRPGYLPWHLDPEEAALLLHVLPRLTAVGAAAGPIYADPGEVPLDGFAFYPQERPLGEPLAAREIDWRHVSMPPEPLVQAFQIPDTMAQQFTTFPQKPGLTLEVDAFHTAPVAGEDGRPWIPKLGLAAEKTGGFIAGMIMSEKPQDTVESIAATALLDAMKKYGIRPTTVHVVNPRICTALAPLAKQLGITLARTSRLPAIEQVRASMPFQIGRR